MQESQRDGMLPLPPTGDDRSWKKKIEELEERLEKTRRRKDKVAILLELSGLTFYTEPEDALDYARQGLRLAKTIDDELEQGRAVARIGEILQYMRRYDEAQPRLEEAITILEKHPETELYRSTLLCLLGTIYMNRGDTPGAIPLLQSALELARKGESPSHISSSLVWLAYTSEELENYSRALALLEEAVQFADAAGDSEGLALAYNSIATIHQKMENYQGGLTMLYHALEIVRSIGKRDAEGVVLGNIVSSYRKLGQLDLALRYSQESLEIFEEMGWEVNIALTCNDMGVCYAELEEWEKAFSFLNRAIEIVQRIGATSQLALFKVSEADTLMRFGDFGRALESLRLAEQMSEELGLRQLLAAVHMTYVEVYEKLEKFDMAFHHMKLYVEIQKELQDLDIRQRLAAMEMRVEVERAEKEKEIFRLKAEQLHRDMEQKNRELAAMALQQAQTGEIVARLQKLVQSMTPKNDRPGEEMAKVLLQHINQVTGGDSQWKIFEERFTPVHPDFSRNLAKRCPDLTPTEMKICTLLRINMSSKEIAAFLGISVRTVEGHRRFIRRRLNLPPDGSLSMFLAGL